MTSPSFWNSAIFKGFKVEANFLHFWFIKNLMGSNSAKQSNQMFYCFSKAFASLLIAPKSIVFPVVVVNNLRFHIKSVFLKRNFSSEQKNTIFAYCLRVGRHFLHFSSLTMWLLNASSSIGMATKNPAFCQFQAKLISSSKHVEKCWEKSHLTIFFFSFMENSFDILGQF